MIKDDNSWKGECRNVLWGVYLELKGSKRTIVLLDTVKSSIEKVSMFSNIPYKFLYDGNNIAQKLPPRNLQN